MNGCEPGEVPISTLGANACFVLRITKKVFRGVVLEHRAGSVFVDLGFARQNWCSEAPVEPHPEASSVSEWLSNQTREENEMAKSKKARKPKVKEHMVIRFAVGKEDAPEKYLNEKNTAYSALMYRAIKEAKQPVTFFEIFDEIKRSVANKTEGKTPKNTLSVILAKMVKEGYVARSEAKEEARAVAA